MLMPSVFGKDLFDDFFDFPFYDNNEMDKLEKKLYGHSGIRRQLHYGNGFAGIF